MKRAGIRIRTWGRAHVYGTAWWDSPHGLTEEERITHPLDEDEAEALNQLDGAAPGSLGAYKAGDRCERYLRRERERLIADGLRILAARGHRGEAVIGAPWDIEDLETRTIKEEK